MKEEERLSLINKYSIKNNKVNPFNPNTTTSRMKQSPDPLRGILAEDSRRPSTVADKYRGKMPKEEPISISY